MTDPAIVVRGLSRFYGTHAAVSDLSLEVSAGTLFGFLGPNGAGKTTTLRVLMGFLRPSKGRACIFGRDVWRYSRAIKADVGFLPSDLRLPRYLRAIDAIGVSARVRKRPSVVPAGKSLAEHLELDLTTRVRAMSRGMRQKLGIVLALAHDPALLVLDEPTTGLDPIAQARLYDLLRRRAASGGTVFFSSHILSEVEELCERVVMLRAGRLIANETIAGLRARATRDVEMRFRIGSPEPEPPACLANVERDDHSLRGRLRGSAEPLLDWLRDRDVVDLRVGAPDLEQLFLEYYREDSSRRDDDEGGTA